MDIFDKLKADCKAIFTGAEARFAAIQSPGVKMAVAIFVALLIIMVVWAILPWIGFIIAAAVTALIVRAFWPSEPKP